MSAPHPADVLRDLVARYLGPNTARNALKTFSERTFGRPAESLGAPEVLRLAEALRPMLRTLLGAGQAEVLLETVRKELA